MIDYRLLRADDMDQAIAQYRLVAALIPGFDPAQQTAADTRALYQEAFDKGPIWGAFDAGNLVGHMALERGWIEHLYVDPLRHGCGIGRELILIAQRDADDLQLWTYQANDRARRVYEVAGFVAEEFGIDPTSATHAPNVRYRWSRTGSGETR